MYLTNLSGVLAYLLQGKPIHRYIAQNYLRVGNLNSRMAEINKAFPGFVQSRFIKYQTKFGDTINIKEYWIPDLKIIEFYAAYDAKKIFNNISINKLTKGTMSDMYSRSTVLLNDNNQILIEVPDQQPR